MSEHQANSGMEVYSRCRRKFDASDKSLVHRHALVHFRMLSWIAGVKEQEEMVFSSREKMLSRTSGVDHGPGIIRNVCCQDGQCL